MAPMEERLGRYQLGRRLSDNDLCDAYSALQQGDGGFVREVVVKRLKDALVSDSISLRAFQNEAHLLARLRQRSIPHVYELQRDAKSGAWFIALEFIPGPTLKWVMESERERAMPLPMALALSVVSQLCAAVHHLHELTNKYGQPTELVHRNLAPENVVLGRDGLARITDFGCALPREQLDATGSDGRGTPGYMAPEQIVGSEPPDRRADVFVLGVLLYEMTTGARLYDGRGERLRRALMDADAPPAGAQRPNFPAMLEEILAGALARDPDARPASAEVLQRQIEGFAAAQRIQLGTARVAAYLAEAFPPGQERAKDGSASFALPGTRTSMPLASSMASASRSSSAPPPRRSSVPPLEESTDLDGVALNPADAAHPDHDEDTMVGQSQRPTSQRPSLSPPRPSTGVYIHVGVPTEDLKKKP